MYRQYSRTVYNLIDVLSTLGGLFSSLSIIGASLSKVFSYNLMLSSLIRKLYHFKPRFESEIKKKKNKKNKDKLKKKQFEEDLIDQKEILANYDDEDDEQMYAAFQGYSHKMNQMKESSQRIFDSMHT